MPVVLEGNIVLTPAGELRPSTVSYPFPLVVSQNLVGEKGTVALGTCAEQNRSGRQEKETLSCLHSSSEILSEQKSYKEGRKAGKEEGRKGRGCFPSCIPSCVPQKLTPPRSRSRCATIPAQGKGTLAP